DLVNLKLPSSFNKTYSALYSKEKKYYESNQYKKSIQTHEEIVAQAAGGPEAEYSLYTIGRIYDEDLKDYESAINAYQRFLKEFPKSSRADKVMYQIARIYENNLLDLNAAVKYYNRLIDEGRDQLWVFQAGIDLAALYSKPVFKKESEVPKILEKLREKVPMREDEVLFKLGESYEKTSKKPEKSLELFEKVVRDYPGSMYFENALDKILADHYKENLEEINKKVIIAREKKSDELLSVLQEKFEKEKFVGNFKEAMNTLGEIKKVVTDTEETLLIDMRSAQIQIEGLKETEKGIEALKKLASSASGTKAEPEILYALGKSLEEYEKDYKNAVDYYEKVIAMNDVHSKSQMMSMFKAGIIYAINLKDYENAFKCYSLIMSKYPNEARNEKLDAKIANLLNIDLNSLQNYLKATKAYSHKETGDNQEASGKTDEITLETDHFATSENSLKKSGEETSIFKGIYDTSLGIIDGFKDVSTRGEDGVIEEEASWFSKASRPVYEDVSWFQKRSNLRQAGEYSWFQKPVDLSDIGISEPSWFKKGGLSIERKLSNIDEETYKLRAEMELAPLKSSKTFKYSNYIENNPESKKLPIVYLYLAISYEDSHDFDKAVETYKKVIADYSQYSKIAYTAYERLSSLMARERREYGKANFLIGRMKEKLPKYFNQADKLSEKIKQYQKIDENDRFINENIGEEKSLDLMYENAKIYEENLGDNAQAISYLNKCASYISGDQEEIKYKLDAARIYSEKMNEYKLAYDELMDILARFPGCTAENEVRYKAADLAISRLSKKETGIALLEKIKDSRKNEEVYKDAMLLLQSTYKEDEVEERFSAVQSLREVVAELKVSPDIEKAFKKLDVDKKAKSLLDMIDMDEENPDNAHYMYYVARLYEREAEDYDNAAKYYREFISMDLSEEKLIQGITSLGLIYETKIKKPEKAIALYREFIVKNQPENTDFLAYLQFKIGEDYELMKKRDECIEAYRKVKFYFPISRWVKTSEDRVAQILASADKFVTIHDRLKDEEDEFATKETGLKQAKGTFEIALTTGEISLSSAEIEIAQEKDPEKKIEKLQALIDSRPEKDPKLPNYLIEIARLYEQGQKADKAAEALKRIVDDYPKFERYYDIALKLAEMYRMAQNVEEATNYYKKIVQESPQYDKTEYVRYMLGKMYIEKREYVYAIDTFRELVERYQDSLYAKKAQYEKGLVNERYMKDYDAAIADFELMTDKYFDHENAPDAQVEIGWIYENAKRDYQKAKDAYQKALDRFPNTPRRREIIESIERVTPKIPK
ncbi:MAG TPA: tetratricopeptide repeat protein, partial [Candidatus Wallbacteria bacterium]|nr:tetratricopeptide repeat protein [Candidatus Wallbacteria bacterium]